MGRFNMKAQTTDFKAMFRPKLVSDILQTLKNKNPNLDYYAVRDDEGMSQIGEFIDKGWEVVIDDESNIQDDSKNEKSELAKQSFRPVPLVSKSRKGEVFVFMCKPTDRRQKDEQERHAAHLKRLELQTGNRKVTKSAGNTQIIEKTLNQKDI